MVLFPTCEFKNLQRPKDCNGFGKKELVDYLKELVCRSKDDLDIVSSKARETKEDRDAKRLLHIGMKFTRRK
ncbi:hypothetical protein O6P43_033367 [Quillaja saponaria]|uniref:Uncharacterized protein n=1 Tax=Quillaja saponaria TaxID=32244 RepID=A0AAD7KQD6_QUISA|nr:hypothetical protein O6P43_033367 [Quillaja saponaria]